jgi:antirestriction protein ArdC
VASHVVNWLKVLKDDKGAIFAAPAHARCAADYLC